MASDPFGRDGYDDRDDIRPRNRQLDEADEQRGQQRPFGGVSYPGHDYWAAPARSDAAADQRPYEGGWTPGGDREANGRRSGAYDPYGREDTQGSDATQGRDASRDTYGPGETRSVYGGGETRNLFGRDETRAGYGRDGARTGYGGDRADWSRGGRGWDDPYDPYGSRRGARWADEPPLVRDRAFEDEGGHGDRWGRGERYERSGDRNERGAAAGARARARGGRDDDSNPSWRTKVRRKRKNMPLWQELPLLLIVAFCLAVLIRTFLVQAFFIPSGSMEQTLLVGDRVLVNKVLYDVREPERGEVVVFTGPDTWAPENQVDKKGGFFAELGRTVGDLVGFSQPGEKDFIKRVIGLPGDTVQCCDANGRVTVNGYPLDESSYLYENSPLDAVPNPRQCTSRRFGPVKVQPGQMWVMGDHRGVSQDSRCQGQVPIANVIGRAFVVLWPSKRWAFLPVPDTFKNIPKPVAMAPPGPHVTRAPVAPMVPDMVIAPIAVSLTLSTRSARRERSRHRRW